MRFIFYTPLVYLFNPPSRTKKFAAKYDVCICAIFKDEAPYMKEWLDHHIGIGISHFYLYDNNSSDDFLKVLSPYIDKGLVTLHNWPYSCSQIQAYENCLEQHSTECRWLGFIDLDEFIVSDGGLTISDFLSSIENKYGSVLLNWKVFGSSGFISRDISLPVTEQFTSCRPDFSKNGKCFFNTRCSYNKKAQRNGSMHHRTWCSIHGISLPPVNCLGYVSFREFNITGSGSFPIWINHYLLKSLDEYKLRCQKSDVFYPVNHHNMNYFSFYDSSCTEKDMRLSPNPYLH